MLIQEKSREQLATQHAYNVPVKQVIRIHLRIVMKLLRPVLTVMGMNVKNLLILILNVNLLIQEMLIVWRKLML